MKLKAKILAGHSVSLVFVVLVGLWGIVNLWRLGQASDAILTENYRSIRAAEGMLDSLERQDSATLLLLLEDEQTGVRLFQDNEIEFLQWLGRAKDNVTINGEAEVLTEIETNYRDYLLQVDQLRQGDIDTAAFEVYQGEVEPEFQAVRQAAVELRDLNQQRMEEASDTAQTASQRAIASMVGAGGSAAVLGLVLSFILSKALTRPLEQMAQATEQLAKGDYDLQLIVNSRDELGQLAQGFMVMSRKLKSFHELNVGRIVAAKHRSEAIIDSLTDGLMLVDSEYRILSINPMAARLFDTTPGTAIGRHCVEIINADYQHHPSRPARSPLVGYRELYEHIQATATGTVTEENRQSEPDSDNLLTLAADPPQYYRYTTTPVKTEQGQRLGVVVLLQDITTLKKLDQLKSQFVATASHELRTPLTGMAMSINLLMESAQQKLSANEQELLSVAQEDIDRLQRLVNDLLDLAKIESGRIEMEPVPTQPIKLAEKMASLMKVQVQEAAIDLRLSVPSDLPLVLADPGKITWVLTNLLANALRYAKTTIAIAAEPSGEFVEWSIVDDGPGIDKVHQAKIFDKFVQVETEQDAGGSGLGLAICKEVVRAHSGTIWVESTPGQGCTFRFTLPTQSVPDSVATSVSLPTGIAHAE
ncbi:ATP-binding protein [Oscillatoria sp. CS-180]|uniref:sensor histidine kinase n=1 Tax=Oscillatoria sp. CS-180 TaxID=3021720 RepID=UPI00232FAB4A|nr:ATP-binding protein [Oscillatoria sp. CS-180]MDB9525089.1 ATP-binding protein [Oscillatoria sp. CS-180]